MTARRQSPQPEPDSPTRGALIPTVVPRRIASNDPNRQSVLEVDGMARRQRTKQTPAIDAWLRQQAEPATMLRAVRQARGGFSYQAAEEFGVEVTVWCRYENGRKRPPAALLEHVARKWNSPAVLLDAPGVRAFFDILAAEKVVDLGAWQQRHLPAQGDYPRDPAPAMAPGRVIPFRRAA